MVDLETMSTRTNALILSIGAYAFYTNEPNDNLAQLDSFYKVFSYEKQRELCCLRHVDPSTESWWNKQSPEARKVINESKQIDEPISFSLHVFSSWLESFKSLGYTPLIYGNGAAFDNAILKSLYEDVDLSIPWNYKADICYRTLRALKSHRINWDALAEEGGVYHNALDDAKYQSKALLAMYLPECLDILAINALFMKK